MQKKKRVKNMLNFPRLDSSVAMKRALRDYEIEGVSDYLCFLCALGADKSEISHIAKNAQKCLKEPYRLKDLAINGEDLIKLQIPQGAVIGEILENLLTEVISHRAKNHKTALCKKAKEFYAKMLKR